MIPSSSEDQVWTTKPRGLPLPPWASTLYTPHNPYTSNEPLHRFRYEPHTPPGIVSHKNTFLMSHSTLSLMSHNTTSPMINDTTYFMIHYTIFLMS